MGTTVSSNPMIPGKISSPALSLVIRFCRSSSFTVRGSYPEDLSSPTVRAGWKSWKTFHPCVGEIEWRLSASHMLAKLESLRQSANFWAGPEET